MTRKHLLKQRSLPNFIIHNEILGHFKYVFTVKKFRMEFVYIRLFKKLLRRRFIKAKTRFFKPKYWLMFLPNYTLTQKSKNARMGAGVGKFIRLASIVKPGKPIIKTWYYNTSFLKQLTNYLTCKIPNKFLLKSVTNQKKSRTNPM